MPWTRLKLIIAVAAGFCCALEIAGAGKEPQLTVYTAQSSYSIPVLDRGGNAYIAVADLLSPLGAAPPKVKGKDWRFELNKVEARLTEGKDKAVIHGNQFDLGGKTLVENTRMLAPMAAALPLLTRLLNTSVDFHQPSHRIFVGNAFTRFTVSFKNGDAPSLVLNFSQPVGPNVSHEEDHGILTHTDRTTLTFRKEPVVTEVNQQQFGDGAIQALTFTEDNGKALLTVTGNEKLKIIRSEDGRTITLQPEAPESAALPALTQTLSSSAESQHHSQEFFVMIDPSHGGYDKGATLGGKLLEKDLTLKLARELRRELDERGIASRMLRDSDVDIDLVRRAEITNEQHAGIYVALHAGGPGRGVRVYSTLLANPQSSTTGKFLPWQSAQAPALERSKAAAQAVSTELRKRGFSVAMLGMPLRPLNNIVPAAIAVELAPEAEGAQSLESAKRNASVMSAIATAIAQMRGQMGARL
ncbi:MAG: N-acetylmuramoyl-L-alanine amidase [Candidatus Angelobacter sp.]